MAPGRQKAPVLNFPGRFGAATGFEGGPGTSPKLTREPKIMLKSEPNYRYILRPRLGRLLGTILHHFGINFTHILHQTFGCEYE